jgi:hypothetical protein
VDGSMQHHCASNRHDRLDASLGDAIVMMCRGASEPHDLLVFSKRNGKSLRGKGSTLIRIVTLRNYTDIATHQLESFFSS